MSYTLWYWDGTTYADGAPEASPRGYVVAVTQPDLGPDRIIVGADYVLYRVDLQR